MSIKAKSINKDINIEECFLLINFALSYMVQRTGFEYFFLNSMDVSNFFIVVYQAKLVNQRRGMIFDNLARIVCFG